MFIVLILRHCTITTTEVTSMTTQAEIRRSSPLVRVLAFLLLAFVIHTSTLDVAHRHGNLSPATASGTAALGDANSDHSTDGGVRSTGQCLICQLHQHLFSTLFISIPGIAPPQAEETYAKRAFPSLSSETHAPRRGRAPPQFSLL